MRKRVYLSFSRFESSLEDLIFLSSLQLLPRIPHLQLIKSPPYYLFMIFIHRIFRIPGVILPDTQSVKLHMLPQRCTLLQMQAISRNWFPFLWWPV